MSGGSQSQERERLRRLLLIEILNRPPIRGIRGDNNSRIFITDGSENNTFVRGIIRDLRLVGNYRFTYMQNERNADRVHIYDIPTDFLENFLIGVDRDWMFDSDTSLFQHYQGGTLVMTKGVNPPPEALLQSFRDSAEHCFLEPVKLMFQKRLNGTKSEKKNKYINSKLLKVDEYLTYYDKGIPENEIQELCDNLAINVTILDIFKNVRKKYETIKKEPFLTFYFCNTRENHVENISKVMAEKQWKDRILKTKDERKQLMKEFDLQGIFYVYDNCSIRTIKDLFFDDVVDKINTWTKTANNGGCIDLMTYDPAAASLTNFKANEFVRLACHFGGCLDYKDWKNEMDLRHIDHRKSYFCYKSYRHYERFKFPMTPVCYTKVNKKFNYRKYPGCYLINNLDFSGCFDNVRLHFKSLKFQEEDVFTVPFLNFLEEWGVTFDLLIGCFSYFYQDIDISPLEGGEYKIVAGKFANVSVDRKTNIKGSYEFSKNFSLLYGQENVVYYDGIITISEKKETVSHRSHISSYMLDYSRIQILEQLFEIDHDMVFCVQLDGIFFDSKAKVVLDKGFRDKEPTYRKGSSCDRYFNSREAFEYNAPEYNTSCKSRLCTYTGGGGCGKTHQAIMESIDLLYVAPTNKLVYEKRKEYNLKNYCTVHKLTGMKCDKWRGYCDNIIIDEVSMMCIETRDKIIELFPQSKITFCGDIGYQLPHYNPTGKGTPMIVTGYERKFEKNYRIKDFKLKDVLDAIREMIDKNYSNREIIIEVVALIPEENRNVDINTYSVEDTIITGTNFRIEEITNYFKDTRPQKWKINKQNEEHFKSDIVIEKDKKTLPEFFSSKREQQPKDSVLQHAFTAHSTQGMTIKNKIFVDIYHLFSEQMLYTIMSRAEKLEQIKFFSHVFKKK